MTPDQATQVINLGINIELWLRVLIYLIGIFLSWKVAMYVWRGLIKSSIRSLIKIKF